MEARRRALLVRQGAVTRIADVGHARPPRQRPDAVVLHKTPGGFDVEFGTEGRQVGSERANVTCGGSRRPNELLASGGPADPELAGALLETMMSWPRQQDWI